MAGLFTGALLFNVDRNRWKRSGHRRLALAMDGADEKSGGVDPASFLIEMGIRAIGNQGVTGGNHLRRQVAVWVEGANDRQIGSHAAADFAEPMAIHVRIRLANR